MGLGHHFVHTRSCNMHLSKMSSGWKNLVIYLQIARDLGSQRLRQELIPLTGIAIWTINSNNNNDNYAVLNLKSIPELSIVRYESATT